MASAPKSKNIDDKKIVASLEKSLKMSPAFHIVLIIEIFSKKPPFA